MLVMILNIKNEAITIASKSHLLLSVLTHDCHTQGPRHKAPSLFSFSGTTRVVLI